MRILMIAPQPWFQPRGTPFSVLHRIKALSLLGHKIDLATYHIGTDIPIDGLRIYRAAKLPFINKVKIGPSKSKVPLDMALYFRAKSLLKKNHYDLLHTHEEAGFFGVNLARKFRLPHLYDMHSSLPQQLSNFKFTSSKLLHGIFERLERRTIESASAMITICPELQKYVASRHPGKTSILIENVADNSLVFAANNADMQSLQEKYHLNGKKVVLYYGTLEPYQGIDLLIESAKQLLNSSDTPVHFLLAGGNPQQVHDYRTKVKQIGIAEHFTFTGFVEPQVIPNLISLSQVLVSPRLMGTNSPLKVYSYLRSGKPIVATRHITHTQILDDSVAILTELTADALAHGICSALEDNTLGQRLSANAKKLVDERFGYDEYLKKTEWIIAQAVRVR
jgi:glycosyltransferase involved in cell wall biosynthesis